MTEKEIQLARIKKARPQQLRRAKRMAERAAVSVDDSPRQMSERDRRHERVRQKVVKVLE